MVHALSEDAEKDAPGEQRCGGSGECCVEDVGIVDTAGELDDCGLGDEGEGCVGEGQVFVEELMEADAVGGVEQEADVPEDGDARVLPKREGGGREEEDQASDGVACLPDSGVGRAHGLMIGAPDATTATLRRRRVYLNSSGDVARPQQGAIP